MSVNNPPVNPDPNDPNPNPQPQPQPAAVPEAPVEDTEEQAPQE